MAAKSVSDQLFIKALPPSVIEAFRYSEYVPNDLKIFMGNHPHLFKNSLDWIVVADLKKFIDENEQVLDDVAGSDDLTVIGSSPPPPQHCVKREPEDDDDIVISDWVKQEDSDNYMINQQSESVKMRTLVEDGQEVIELLDTNDEDSEELSTQVQVLDTDPEHGWQHSTTRWDDPGLTSEVYLGPTTFKLTRKCTVKRFERIKQLPVLFPVPEESTAFLVDLSDHSDVMFYEQDGQVMAMDWLIKNKDNDSWDGPTGTGSSLAMVSFDPENPLDGSLTSIERRELDPAPREAIRQAQKKIRMNEGSSRQKRAEAFLTYCQRLSCKAIDLHGNRCTGSLFLKEITIPSEDRAGNVLPRLCTFMACNGWKQGFTEGHTTTNIWKDIDISSLQKAIADQQHSGNNEESSQCAGLVSAQIGEKLKFCKLTGHMKCGRAASSPMKSIRCPSKQTIFVPVDTSIWMAIVLSTNNVTHLHPIPFINKPHIEAKYNYKKLVSAIRVVGATVQHVDSASTTAILLGNKLPSEHDLGLHNSRVKAGTIQEMKAQKYTARMGLPGIYDLFLKDQALPNADDIYIHQYINIPSSDGITGVIIFTCVPSLICLIHEVSYFEADVTSKRISSAVDEWKLVINPKGLQHAITLAHRYVNRGYRAFYKQLYDTLQDVVQSLTKRPLRGDMEVTHIQGLADSFFPTNDPSFSGINVATPNKLIPYIFRLCGVHGIRAVLDFKGLVTLAEFSRLMAFLEIQSTTELQDFREFIKGLKVKKITALSKMLPEHLESIARNTNITEGQHAWTNRQTGTQLSPVEALESARKVDFKVASEVEITCRNGSLQNTQNKRSALRDKTAKSEKALEKANASHATSTLQQQIDKEKDARRESLAREKALKDQLTGLKPGATGNSTKHAKTHKAKTAESSSSGRVQSSNYSRSLSSTPQSPTHLSTAFLPGAQADVDMFCPFPSSQNTTILRDHVENIPAPLASTPDPHYPINIPDDYVPSEGDLRHIEQFLATVASDSSFSTCTSNVGGSLLQYLYDGEPDGERAPKRPRLE
ncbi:hypothetical protein AAF712_015787 [Marasmius tenuissimus]|uniref:Uncharacterized protein n=1 Tax=Marasmius tenuissimus TaxID=585030 RepID=A0ABR2Z8A5_9AGAR